MNGYNLTDLTDGQKELLRKLVRCVREGKLKEPIAPVSTDAEYFISLRGEDFKHPGDLIGDLDDLCDAHLMGVRWEKGKRFYNIRQAGYDAVDNDFGAPLMPKSPVIAQPTKERPGALPMAQVFLCYAREDEEKVGDLYQRLSNAGFKPWMAKRDLLPGETWELSIYKAIQRSDFFLACLSANSVDKRGFLQKEIKKALDIWQEKLEDDIYLIPVRLEDCEVPESLRKFQWVNLFEADGWTRLVKAIQVGMERRAETSAESVTETETRVPPTPTEKTQTTSRITLIHVTPTGQHSLIESNDRLIAIGRAPKNHVQVLEQEVSWEHGQIILMQGGYYYHHLSKRNPSILRRRGEEYLLRAGGEEEILLRNQDRLTIGNTTFIIEFDLINEDTGYTTTAEDHEDI